MTDRYDVPSLRFPRCSICGEPATGGWHGEEVITVCYRCATEELPRPIVDVCLDRRRQYNRLAFDTGALIRDVSLAMWRASAALAQRAMGDAERAVAQNGGDLRRDMRLLDDTEGEKK